MWLGKHETVCPTRVAISMGSKPLATWKVCLQVPHCLTIEQTSVVGSHVDGSRSQLTKISCFLAFMTSNSSSNLAIANISRLLVLGNFLVAVSFWWHSLSKDLFNKKFRIIF